MELSVEYFEMALDEMVRNNTNSLSFTQREIRWVIDELNKTDKVTVSVTTHYHPAAKPIDGMI